MVFDLNKYKTALKSLLKEMGNAIEKLLKSSFEVPKDSDSVTQRVTKNVESFKTLYVAFYFIVFLACSFASPKLLISGFCGLSIYVGYLLSIDYNIDFIANIPAQHIQNIISVVMLIVSYYFETLFALFLIIFVSFAVIIPHMCLSTEMGVFSILTRYNLVALFCALLSTISFTLIILSFFLPWVENKDYLKNEALCNSVFPPLNGISIKSSCVHTNAWDATIFQVADYITSISLVITIIVIVVSIIFDVSQVFKRKLCCLTLPSGIKYLSLLSFFINFISLNIFIFIFFKDTQQITDAANGSLVEVSWGFWFCFLSALLLLLAAFINVSFSSPPKQKKVFL